MLSGQLMQAIEGLLELQLELVLMIGVGLLLAKKGILHKEARKNLSDVAFSILIPCSILKSYMNTADTSILLNCSLLLGVAAAMQLLYIVLNRLLYRKQPAEHRQFLRYMTLCSNSGFLGVAVSQGLYGDLGLIYNSVYMVPQRIFMWTVGMTYFGEKISGRHMARKALLHPCLAALYLGVFLMAAQISLPAPVRSAVNAFGGCMIPAAMLITGGILSDMDPRDLIDRESLYFSAIRLIALPLIALFFCGLIPVDAAAGGIAVLMAGMPAATVTVLFAAKYGGDAKFATKCVVLTTLLSIVTIPLWAAAVLLLY